MPETFALKPRIELDGAQLPPEVDVLLERATVDDHLFLPDMFTLRFRDPGRTVLKDAHLQIGSGIRILAGPAGQEATEPLITGEVTSLEAEFDVTGTHAIVRGYDHSHRLHRGRHTQTFRDVTDADIARRIAKGAGLETGQVDDPGVTHTLVSQVNVTDWEFLKARAREIGFDVAVRAGKVEFRRPAEADRAPDQGDLNAAGPLQLVLGGDLESFRPRLTSSDQVKTVEVRGWDPGRKQAVVGRAPAETTSVSLAATTPGQLAAKFGDPTFVSVDRPFSTQAEVDAAAKALADQIAGSFAEAEGVAKGNPKVQAGAAVSIGLAGEPFDGRYTVTSSRHVFGPDGYKTHFVVSGKQERSLLGLASLGATNGSRSGGGPPIYGVVIAEVTDVRDPQKLARVKLKFPWLSETYESDWVRVTYPGAGKKRGLVLIPEVNDEVLVAFEHGDVRRPYVIGGLFNGKDMPVKYVDEFDRSTGAVDIRHFHSRSGQEIFFSDGADVQGITIQTSKAKQIVSLDETNREILIENNGSISIRGGSVFVEGGTVKIKASGQLELSGDGGVKLSSGGVVEISGAQVKLN
jgi:phage protein D